MVAQKGPVDVSTALPYSGHIERHTPETRTETMTTTTKRITTYGDLKNGDHVWIQGYLFEVVNLRIVSARMDSIHEYGPGRPVVRFEGRVIDPKSDIARTTYDGGTYGAYAWVPCVTAVNMPAEKGGR